MTVLPDALVGEVARRFALLGDPTRLRIVKALHDGGERSVQEIADQTGTSVANASQHLARLREGGIVRGRRVGRTVRYSIADPSIEGLCTIVCDRILHQATALGAIALDRTPRTLTR